MVAHDIWKKKFKKYCPHINNSREELDIIRTCTCGHYRFKFACSYMFMITFWKIFYWKKFFLVIPLRMYNSKVDNQTHCQCLFIEVVRF